MDSGHILTIALYPPFTTNNKREGIQSDVSFNTLSYPQVPLHSPDLTKAGHLFIVLIARDKGFADLIDELKTQGVRVYLVASEFSNGDLVEKVGRQRWIQRERTDFLLLPIPY